MNHPHDETTRYVIVFQARSGSTYLTEVLDSHPSVYAMGEKFAELKSKGPVRQLAAMRKFFEELPDGDFAAIGFKTKLRDVADRRKFAELLQEHKVQVIFLGRRNIVKHVVSCFNSQRLYDATGDWNLYRDSDRLSSFRIDPEEFANWLRKFDEGRKALEEFVMALQLPTLCLYYEDLLAEREKSVALALSFLRVPVAPLQGRTKKNTSDDLRDVVNNFDELRSKYIGTPYGEMFDEVLALDAGPVNFGRKT